MFCPKCGKPANERAAFCENCGADLSQSTQPVHQATPYSGSVPHRSIALCIILSFVTCGLYTIYWFICLANDLNTASGRTNDTSGGVVFLLSLVTCGIYSLVWLYKAGDKVDMIRTNRGESPVTPGLLYLLLSIFGLTLVSYCIIQNELNEAAK